MKHSTKITECPKCGGKEMGKGKHSGYGTMYPDGKMSLGSDIEYIICTECGFIIEGYVKKPEKFKGTLF
ncbi:transcription initiation factor TFIIIB [Lysinibacillus pakistanensis]|uniref:Transcription initiation factor TFIIIB n=1 Tax=Lysinibacillus pakistanensis TaxID=759811 RepID=A0AAX3WXM4_9BACI|nr:transcription initiation factor TFIIIB [Lysinibacillus pakistanensis]MDM5231914.1 transcription initiation factor TFIIIB [Lysinibacillus pakistanensis]WHY47445.1 transcription initiation factor TFIIIB [Lysinibacillus pakistanensis]WHY52455.1 transcription initiation factor TFIIIB [Lysinibacillus pakistanensis]